MLNKIYLIFTFIFIGQSHADWTDYIIDDRRSDKFSNIYEYVVYSVLSDLDDELENELIKSDSLIQIIIEEFEKLRRKEVCENKYCIDGCDDIRLPQNLFYKLPLGKWFELWKYAEKNKITISTIDTLYEERCRPNVTNCPIKIIEIPLKIIDACFLHFSSKKSSKGEQIILINNTAYRIVKKKNGNTVLRKMN